MRAPARAPWVSRAMFLIAIAALVVCSSPAPRAASLSAVTPLGASAGVTVQITGSGFDPTATNNEVVLIASDGTRVSVAPISIVTVDPATNLRRLAVVVPSGLALGPASVRVTNKTTGGLSEGRSLEVIAISLAGVDKAPRGVRALAVRITGSPNAQFVVGRTRAVFGGGVTVTSTTVESPTSLVATIDVSDTATPGARTITVVSSTQTAMLAGAFAVEGVPSPGTNQAPVVNLGPDQAIVTPPGVLALTPTVTDDGLPNPPGQVTHAWTAPGAPGPVAFADASSKDTTASFTVPGTYVLRLAVSDGALGASDDMAVVVRAADVTGPRVSAAVPAGTVPGPIDRVTLTFNEAIQDGTFTAGDVSLAGPGGAIGIFGVNRLTSAQYEVVFASQSAEGPYVLGVGPDIRDLAGNAMDQDQSGSSGEPGDRFTTSVTLSPTNAAPSVSAGPDQAITLPTNTVVLNGVATDDGRPAGSVLTIRWSRLSGPADVAFGDPSRAATSAAFSTAGTYLLRLTASDGEKSSADEVTVVVSPQPAGPPPTAIAGGPYSGLAGQEVAFDGRASFDPAGESYTLEWDFGDGTRAAGLAPSHIYTSANGGVPFAVVLTLRTASGRAASASTLATIGAPPPPSSPPPSASPGGPYSGVANRAIAFDGSQSRDPDGRPLTFLWGFGDGTTGIGPTPLHVYPAASTTGPYAVTLTVTNDRGVSDTKSTTAAVTAPVPANQAPVSRPGGPYTGLAGQAIAFDGRPSSDPEQGPLTFAWTFGDGATATGATPSHAYASAGSYLAALTVTDNSGTANTAVAQVTVSPAANTPPEARAGGPYEGAAGALVAFDGRGSRDAEGDPLTYAWDFGDGQLATGATPTHAYDKAGTYTVTLTVRDSRGATGQATTSAAIGAAADRTVPRVVLTTPRSVLPGAQVTVTADATDDVGVASVTFAVNGAGSVVGAAVDTSAPYDVVVGAQATATPGAAITVRATARDAAGNAGDAQATVGIVAAPDAEAPTVVLTAPLEAAPGSAVVLTADARDNVGVSSVQFSTGGTPIATLATPPYQFTYRVPDNVAVGGSLSFNARATDFSSNTAESEATVMIVAAPPPTPPSVKLTVPGEVYAGSALAVSASATDAAGIAGITLFVDDVRVATVTGQTALSASVPVPAGRGAGSVLGVKAQALNVRGVTASDAATVRVVAAPQATSGIVGRVFDDSTGQPVRDAIARLVGRDGAGRPYAAVTATDARGRFFFASEGGEATVEIAGAGWTRVDRPVAFSGDAVIRVLDARLTPLSVVATPLTALLGGAVESGPTKLVVPPGALPADGTLRVTAVGQQGIAGPLPLGWSPVGAVEVSPRDVTFIAPATLTLVQAFGLAPGTTLVLATWDDAVHAWRALGTVPAGAPGARLSASVSTGGQYAWLLADEVPLAPAVPAPGDLLAGVARADVPADATITISPSPRVVIYQPGIRASVSAVLGLSAALSSGAHLVARLTETYRFHAGGELTPEQLVEDLVYYQAPAPANALSASWVVTPSIVFEAADLLEGVIGVEVLVPGVTTGPALTLVGADGGSVSLSSGERVDILADTLAMPTPVQLAPIPPAALGAALPPDLELLGALSLALPGTTTLPRGVILSIPRPSSVQAGDIVLLLRLDEWLGATRIVLVGAARVGADRIFSDGVFPGVPGVPEGARQEGRYLFVRARGGVGFATGTVLSSAGAAAPGAIASLDTLPVVARTAGDGRYVLVAPVGQVSVSALDPVRSDAGQARGMIANAGDVARVDIQLQNARPGVTSISPADGAVDVSLGSPLVVRFSTALDPASLQAQGVTPIALSVDGETAIVAGALTLDSGNTRLTLRPSAALAPNTTYRAVVSGALRDVAGRPLAAPFTWQFRSLDTAAPPPPAAGALSVGIPGTDGFATVSGTQGTASPIDRVQVVNRTKNTFTPVLVEANGGFSVRVPTGIGDVLVLSITDQAGNETTVPLTGAGQQQRQTNPDGSVSAVVGPEGGRIEGPNGLVVDVPKDAFPQATVVTITSVSEQQFPVQLTAEQRPFFQYTGGFALDFRGATPATYVNVSLPASPGDTPEDRWVVGQVALVNGQPTMAVADTARVIDGRVTTSSPPCPGVRAAEKYAFVKSVARPVGLVYGPEPSAWSQRLAFEVLTLSSLALPAAGVLGVPGVAAVTMPWAVLSAQSLAPGFGAQAMCLPVLTGRVTVVPNRQTIRIDASEFEATDRELVVRNTTTNGEYRYPRNLVQHKFLVDGVLADEYEVVAVSATGDRDVPFEVARASATKVSIKVGMDAFASGVTQIEITNKTQRPGTPTEFPQASAAVGIPVAGAAGDLFEVTAEGADGASRPLAFRIESPDGAGNLVARALPVTIDPDTRVFLISTLSGSETEIPPDAFDGVGGFRYAFTGSTDETYALAVQYPDGKRDTTTIPKLTITIAQPSTGRTTRTLTLPAPPPDEPFNLGSVDPSASIPVLLGTPGPIGAFDPAGVLSFRFSGAIDRASAAQGTRLLDEDGTPVAGEVRLSAGNTVVTFVPAARLRMGTRYTVVLEGLLDGAGRAVSASRLEMKTTAPSRVAEGIGSDVAGFARDVVFRKKRGPDGRDQITAVILSSLGGDRAALVTVDVTDPNAPEPLGSVEGPLGRFLAIVPDADMTLRGPHPCKGGVGFDGDLVISTFSNVSQIGAGSSVQFYDVTDPASPCRIGAKLLNFPGSGTTGAINANGAAVGVAGLQTTSGVASYVAVADLGLLSVDVGSNVPAREPVGSGDPASILPGDYRAVISVGSYLAAADAATPAVDLVDPSLAVLGHVDLSSMGLTPVTLAYGAAFPIDTDGNGEVDPSERRDLLFVGGVLPDGASGAVVMIDLTNPAEPELVGVVPIPGEVDKVAVDAERFRVLAGATTRDGDWRIFNIDLTGESPFAEKDADEDGLDDRIVWQSPSGYYFNSGAFALDPAQGLLFVSSRSGGLDAWSLVNVCCDLGVDFADRRAAAPTGEGDGLLEREKAAIQKGIAAGLAYAQATCGGAPPVRDAGTPASKGDDALTIIEQGSGACIWKADIVAACDKVYQPGVSDHDFEVFMPDKYFTPAGNDNPATCVTKALASQFAIEDGTPRPIDVDGVEVSFRDITFFPVSKERFENAKLDLARPTASGFDATGDMGLGRQQLLLKWLLEGEYIDVPGYNVTGHDLEDILTTLRADTSIPTVEGYEWALLMHYTLAKARSALRIVGASNPSSTLHDLFVAQAHDTAKAGIRAALARMAVDPAARGLVLGTSRADYEGQACLTITAGSDRRTWRPKACTSFEEFIGSVAGKAAQLETPLFSDAEVADLVHRFYRVKADVEAVPDDAAANEFIAAAMVFVDQVLDATRPVYERDIGLDPSTEVRRRDNARYATEKRVQALNASVRIKLRAFNLGFRDATGVTVRMYRGQQGPGALIKDKAIDLAAAEEQYLDREGPLPPAPPDEVTPADRNLIDLAVVPGGVRPAIFLLGDAKNAANPPVNLEANRGVPSYVGFTIDLPDRKVREANRANNFDGFWFYVLDPANPAVPDLPPRVPLPIPDPDGKVLDPDPECGDSGDLVVSQAFVMLEAPSVELPGPVLVEPVAKATVRVSVANPSRVPVRDLRVCSTGSDDAPCASIAEVAAGGREAVDLPFTAPASNQVLELVARASAPSVGVRESAGLLVLVGCEPYVVVAPAPDPNPRASDPAEWSTAMQGGQALRYARVLRRDTGVPAAGVPVNVTVTDSVGNRLSVSASTDADGNVVTGAIPGLVVPVGKALPAGTRITATVAAVNGAASSCSTGTKFEAVVTDRSYRRNWTAGASIAAAGTIEVGLQGKLGAGLQFGMTESKAGGRQRLDVGRTFNREAGVVEKIGQTDARLFLGAATVGFEASATAGGLVRSTYGDQYSFSFAPGASGLSSDDAARFGAVVLAGLAGFGDPLTTKLLTTFASAIDPAPNKVGETVSLGVEGSMAATASLKAGLSASDTESGDDLGGIAYGLDRTDSGSARLGFAWSVNRNTQKQEISPSYELRGGIDIQKVLDAKASRPEDAAKQDGLLGKLGTTFKASVAGSARAAVTFDTAQDFKFKRLQFSFGGTKNFGWVVDASSPLGKKKFVPIDGSGTGRNTITFTFSDPAVLAQIVSSLQTINPLADFRDAAGSPAVRLLTGAPVLGPLAIADEMLKLVGVLIKADAEYEITEERGDPYRLSFGGSLGVVGITLKVKPELALDRSLVFTTERGRVRGGRVYPLAKYTKDDLIPDVTASGRADDLLELADAAFGALGSGLGDTIDVVKKPATSGTNTIRSLHTAELRFNGDGQPGLEDGLFLVSFAYDALPEGEEPLMRRPDDVEWAIDRPHYGVGGFHQFGPPGLQLVSGGTLTFFYDDDEVVGVDESQLGVYRWDESRSDWDFLGGTPNPDANTVTIPIDTLALYTVAAPMPAGAITFTATYVPAGDALDPHTIVTYTSDTLRLNNGQAVPDGTLYTVFGAHPGAGLFLFGNVLSDDLDQSTDGVQVASRSGVIQFTVDYPGAEGIAIALAFSRDGTALSDQALPIRPVPQP